MNNMYIKKMVKINMVLVGTLVTLVTGCSIGQKSVKTDENIVPVTIMHEMTGNDIGLVCCTDVTPYKSTFIDSNGRIYIYNAYCDDMCVNDWYTCVYDRETLKISIVRYERPDMLYELMD